jgi:hypothetical protein
MADASVPDTAFHPSDAMNDFATVARRDSPPGKPYSKRRTHRPAAAEDRTETNARYNALASATRRPLR